MGPKLHLSSRFGAGDRGLDSVLEVAELGSLGNDEGKTGLLGMQSVEDVDSKHVFSSQN